MGGLSLHDFSLLTPFEFQAVLDAWNSHQEALGRERWEVMRTGAAVSVSPWVKGHMSPRRLIPLPWDRPQAEKAPPVTAAEDKARLEQLMLRLRKNRDKTNQTD